MMFFLTENYYLYFALQTLMYPLDVVHIMKVSEENVPNVYSTMNNIIIIDTQCDPSAWYEMYCTLHLESRLKFIFWGEDVLARVLAGENFILSSGTRPEDIHALIEAVLLNKIRDISGKTPVLTPREKMVLINAISGKRVHQIASSLNMSRKTVYHHRMSACRKLGVRNILHLATCRDPILNVI
ncbi:helix-turn-helix transcriptional regulator [Citrobacter koseri]|uniref:helix-turn-helix domain-containing protein n=1 Tax=Citrobacter koseri TaxID=545 RepID=UPI00190198BC|nr:helix-turn-helix transcriptional regulator [Citrobacter koseri]MBJ8986878.1 helix-turn-helix transcriptional regulator [Citrobacter koseri]MBJ9011525.1 helix-turn-helix transcriptional regulator [Citrobacter koseri]